MCRCVDHSGKQKKLYRSFSEAEQAKKYREQESIGNLSLNIYRCPNGNGFHLTKKQTSY